MLMTNCEAVYAKKLRLELMTYITHFVLTSNCCSIIMLGRKSESVNLLKLSNILLTMNLIRNVVPMTCKISPLLASYRPIQTMALYITRL